MTRRLTFFATLLAVLFLTAIPLMAQDAPSAPKDVKFYEIFITPGAKAVVMWMLLLASVAMLALIVELFIRLRAAKLAPPAVVALLRELADEAARASGAAPGATHG